MARPREFIYMDALEQAMNVFWEQGYRGTSMSDLVDVMGINKSSLYDTFGNKERLFGECLRLYGIILKAQIDQIIVENDTVMGAIRGIFTSMIESLEKDDDRGCLLSNALMERNSLSPEVKDQVVAGMEKLCTVFTALIQKGQDEGSISKEEDAEFLAKYLMNVITGIRTIGRMEQDRDVLFQMVDRSLQVLEPSTVRAVA